jgi:hypothetical protein
MAGEMTAGQLQEILVRHDPLAAWPPAARAPRDYHREAQLAAQGLRAMLGLGHVRTVVADALDQIHPGLYQAFYQGDQGDRGLGQRLGRVAKDIWDDHGRHRGHRPRSENQRTAPLTAGPAPPPVAKLVADHDLLTAWLRDVEDRLYTERDAPGREPQSAAAALRGTLPALAEAYDDASDDQRTAIRLAFSRFRRVQHQLSAFAAAQLGAVQGPAGVAALRQALLVESILDLGLDWRDELLLLRDLRRAAEAAGLPFGDLLRQAAARSSPKTTTFLLGVLGERSPIDGAD